MSKKKKKRLDYDYTDSVTPKDQQRQLDELLYIQQLVENGESVPSDMASSVLTDDGDMDVDVPDMVSSFVTDAVMRLNRSGGVIPTEPKPLTPISTSNVPTITPIDCDDSDYEPRDIIPVKHQSPVVIGDVTSKIPTPQSFYTAERNDTPVMKPKYDVQEPNIPDQVEEDEQDLMSFEDFVIVLNNDEDCVVTVRNPYTDQEGVSINTFCLRGYKPVNDKNYELLKANLPLLMSMLAGPALIVESTSEPFKKIIHGAVTKGLDPKKVMIFTSPGENVSYFIVYVMDSISRGMVLDAIIPQLESTQELTHFITVVCDLMANEMLNPMATEVSSWLKDYLEESVTNPDIEEDFCRIIAEDQGYDDTVPSRVDMEKFVSNHVIGDIAKFINTTRELSEFVKGQMSPKRYVEPFIEDDSTVEEYHDELDNAGDVVVETTSVSASSTVETQDGIVLSTEDVEIHTEVKQETVEVPVEKVEVPPVYKRDQDIELVYRDPEGSKSSGIIIDVS